MPRAPTALRSNGQSVGFRPVYVWDVLQTEGKISRCCWDSVGANQRKLNEYTTVVFPQKAGPRYCRGFSENRGCRPMVIIYRRTGGQPR